MRDHTHHELLLALDEHLEVLLRERNALLFAAGYARHYTASDLDEALALVRDALGD